MEENKISFEDFSNPEYIRKEQMKEKSEAVWVAFLELDGLVNVSRFAREYLGRSQSWFVQKLRGMNVCGRRRHFTADEYAVISESFRDIARRLDEYADAIDGAKITAD